MSFRHDLQNLSPQARHTIQNREAQGHKVESNKSSEVLVERNRHPIAIFMKLGNEVTKQFWGIETLQLYEKFCRKHKDVWFSTDSLSTGMAETRRQKFLQAIKQNAVVEMYFVVGKNSGGENQIVYRAEVTDILSDPDGMKTPDATLTPAIWCDIQNKIWIKVKDVAPFTKLTTNDFVVESSGKVLAESIAGSQYHFGYIKMK